MTTFLGWAIIVIYVVHDDLFLVLVIVVRSTILTLVIGDLITAGWCGSRHICQWCIHGHTYAILSVP